MKITLDGILGWLAFPFALAFTFGCLLLLLAGLLILWLFYPLYVLFRIWDAGLCRW